MVLCFSLSCNTTGKFTKMSNQEETSSSESQPFSEEFCGGSASVPRGFVLQKLFPNRVVEDLEFCDEVSVVESKLCDDSSVVVDSKTSPLSECRDTEQRM